MKQVILKKGTFKVPENLKECSMSQITHIMTAQTMLFYFKEAALDERIMATKVSILLCLVDIEKKYFDNLFLWQKQKLMNLVRWAFTAKFDEKPFDSFEHDGMRYILPADNFADTTALEWALCNIYYMHYAKSPDKKHLFYQLIATICRPERPDLKKFKADLKRWNGDERVIFNSVDADARAKDIENVPFGVLIAIFQYWEAMNNRFVKRNDELFEGGEGDGIFQNGEGYLSLLEDVAEEGIMGDLEKVHETNISGVFMYLRNKQKKIRQREKELAAANNS